MCAAPPASGRTATLASDACTAAGTAAAASTAAVTPSNGSSSRGHSGSSIDNISDTQQWQQQQANSHKLGVGNPSDAQPLAKKAHATPCFWHISVSRQLINKNSCHLLQATYTVRITVVAAARV
jgi:hypothetical protein